MRKANKIMMATVSTLLTLTLISSCILSGLYAKYVTKEDSKVTVDIKKFGVKITTTVDPALAKMANKNSVYDTTDEATLEITYSGIKLHPDVYYPEAVKFKVEGSADVKLALKLYINLEFATADGTANKVTVPADIAKISSEQVAMPLGYTFGAKKSTSNDYVISNAYAVEPWRFNKAPSAIENAIVDYMQGEIDIIATIDNTLVFVEVKTLPSGNIETLELILGKIKQKRIAETTKCFLNLYRQYNDRYIRFDVIVIDMPGFDSVYHLENAFSEPL